MHDACMKYVSKSWLFELALQQAVIKLSVVSFRHFPTSLFRELVYTIYSQTRYIAR